MSNSEFTAWKTMRYGMPYLVPGQAQKEFFVNQSLALIDAVVQPSIIASLNEPPANSKDGMAYRVSAPAAGEWAGHEDAIAIRIAGDWSFVEPPPGMRVWDQSLQQSLLFNNAWLGLTPPSVSVGGDVVDEQARLAIDELIQVLRIAGVFAKL